MRVPDTRGTGVATHACIRVGVRVPCRVRVRWFILSDNIFMYHVQMSVQKIDGES